MIRRIARELRGAVLVAALALGALKIVEVMLRAADRLSPLGHLHGLLRDWTTDGALGWVVLGLLVVSLTYPTRALLALRARDDSANELAGELRVLSWLGAAASATFLLAAILRSHTARVDESESPEKVAYFYLVRFGREMMMWSITGAGLVLLAALWGAFGVIWARRDRSGSRARLAAAAGITAIVGVTGLSLLQGWITSRSFTVNPEWMLPERRYEAIVHLGDPLVHGRWALIFVALVAAAAILLAARGERRPAASPRETSAAAGLFVLGLVAFALTRGAAHDALHPLPFWEGSAAGWLDPDTVAALPPGESCVPGAQDYPILELGGDGRARVNGGPWGDAAQLLKKLEDMKQLWSQVQPRKRFPGHLGAAIPEKAPIAAVAPLFEAAHTAGYDDLEVIEALPRRTYVTRTLGEITYRPRVCHVPLQAAVALPRQGTWGDFVRSLPAP